MKELKGYERYQLQWMIEHGFSLKDLFSRMDKIVYETYNESEKTLPSQAFEDFEEIGFKGSEIWVCQDEWEDNDENEYISYDVGFLNNAGEEDETQFDILSKDNQSEAISELMNLFHHFCLENNIEKGYIIYINESD